MENLESIIDNTCLLLRENYIKILRYFYPALGSNGFEERNLSHNFVFSFIQSLNDSEAFAWFEVSIMGGQKMDCVVFSPKVKSVFFIESKRFVNGKIDSKKDSLREDYKRIIENHLLILDNKRWKGGFEISYKFAILLCDIWTEREDSSKLKMEWKENKCFENLYSKVVSIVEGNKNIEFNYENTLKNYHILIGVNEINTQQLKN